MTIASTLTNIWLMGCNLSQLFQECDDKYNVDSDYAEGLENYQHNSNNAVPGSGGVRMQHHAYCILLIMPLTDFGIWPVHY